MSENPPRAVTPARPLSPCDRRVSRINAAGALLSLALAVLLASVGRSERGEPLVPTRAPEPSAESHGPEVRNGRRVLVDASGEAIELGRFERIASASALADPILLALSEPDRILSFSSRSQRTSPDAHRYAGKPGIDAAHKLEPLLMLQPDLVLLNGLGNVRHVASLREAGLTVFDLGPMRGVHSLLRSIRQIGWLLGAPERAERFAERFLQQMVSVADAVPASERKRALYVGTHGRSLFGGTRGSSFGDVLRYAGLIDVAAAEFSGWPRFTPEQLLMLDPEIIVTQSDMAAALCGHSELHKLRACQPEGKVIEIEDAVISDPGVGMLDAAERIVRRAYPERYGRAPIAPLREAAL